jgi:hypothetical protein
MPVHVGGGILDTTSLRPTAETTSPKTQQLLTKLGRTIDDLELATAQKSGFDITITAVRIKGTDGNTTLEALQQVDEADPGHIAVYGRADVGGKSVVTRTVGGVIYDDYASADTVFELSGSATLVAEALGEIP